jgi:hypothetical protein
MFVEYLHDRAGGSFEDFVVAVGKGEPFDVAIQEHYGDSLNNLWNDFLESLNSGSETPRGQGHLAP